MIHFHVEVYMGLAVDLEAVVTGVKWYLACDVLEFINRETSGTTDTPPSGVNAKG